MISESKPKRRPAEPAVPLHIYLSRMMDANEGLTNVEVAQRLGYPKPNVVAMMRSGTMKVPLTMIPALASILGVEPLSLMQRALMAYAPELWTVLESVVGEKAVTNSELELLSLLREETRGLDPALARNEQFRQRFTRLIGEFLDVQVLQDLAVRKAERQKRDSAAARANAELEGLCRQQALERMALRRRLAR